MNVTVEPPPAGCTVVALLAIAAFTNPCGVDQISIVRSSTAAGFGCAAGGVPAMFQANVPLTSCSGLCGVGVGRTRPGSTVWMRVIRTRALLVSKLMAAL